MDTEANVRNKVCRMPRGGLYLVTCTWWPVFGHVVASIWSRGGQYLVTWWPEFGHVVASGRAHRAGCLALAAARAHHHRPPPSRPFALSSVLAFVLSQAPAFASPHGRGWAWPSGDPCWLAGELATARRT